MSRHVRVLGLAVASHFHVQITAVVSSLDHGVVDTPLLLMFNRIPLEGFYLMEENLHRDLLLKAYAEAAELESEMVRLKSRLQEVRWGEAVLVGEGGAKKVYMTTDKVTGRKVAKAYPKDSERVEDFLREARLHARLDHAQITPVHDIGVEDGVPYFSMKYLEGGTLEQWVEQRFQTDAQYRTEALDMFLKVCEALAYAHSVAVCHLDLKPANVQISSYGEVFVSDWGLARVEGSSAELLDLGEKQDIDSGDEESERLGQFTRYGLLSGTPGFMAPEQCVKGKPKDARTDIYALGALLVYLLTGKPHVAGGQQEMIQATLAGQWAFGPEAMPSGLNGVVSKALSSLPAERYASVECLVEDVRAYRLGFLTSADERSTWQLAQSLYRRNRKVCWVAAFSGLVFILTTAVFVVTLRQSERAAVAAGESAERSEAVAREALSGLQQSQQQRQQLAEEFASDYVRHGEAFYFNFKRGENEYNQAEDERGYALVSKALLLRPGDKRALALKGRLAMLTYRLDEALKAFQQLGPEFEIHAQVCREFRGENLRNVQVMVPFLRALLPSKDFRLIHDFMFQVVFSRRPLAEQIYFAEETLNMRTPRREGRLNFHFNRQKMSLDISNNPTLWTIFTLKNIPFREVNFSKTNISVDFRHLRKMPLVKLNVSHTGMSNEGLGWVVGRPLRDLDISYSQVTSLERLRDMPLTTLNIAGLKIEQLGVLSELKTLEWVGCDARQVEELRKYLDTSKVELHILP